MLTEDRQKRILDLLEERGSIQASDLVRTLNSSISTIRRDLQSLEQEGKLIRVHGGAVKKSRLDTVSEDWMSSKRSLHAQEKKAIGQKAASLVAPGDFVYIDAGTTTEAMVQALLEPEAEYVTNAIAHAQTLASKGMKVSILGGPFKAITEAIVGEPPCTQLLEYNFDKGFFGSNGIDESGRLSTPDPREAAVKRTAMNACQQVFVLCDPSKLFVKSRCNFGSLSSGVLITDSSARGRLPAGWKCLYADADKKEFEEEKGESCS